MKVSLPLWSRKSVFQQGTSLWKLVYTSVFEIIFVSLWPPYQSKLQGTDSIPKDGNATWPFATPFLEVLITPEVTICVPDCLLEFLSSLLAFVLLNFHIIISSSLTGFSLSECAFLAVICQWHWCTGWCLLGPLISIGWT